MSRILPKRWPLLLSLAVALVSAALLWHPGAILDYFRHGTALEVFTLVMFLIFLLPPLAARWRLPAPVALLAGGILLGPYVFGIIEPQQSAVELLSSVGRVFLMFIVGLEIDMRVFQATRQRSIAFGLATFLLPLAAGAGVARLFGFDWLAALLVGSLISSHTLLGFPILTQLGLAKREAMAVVVGATIFTDIAALLVLAICISIHEGGFSPAGLAYQILALTVYSIIVLQGLPLLGRRFFRRHRDNESNLFSFTFLVLMLAAAGAHLIHLEDIVGAFLAGVAVNRVLAQSPVREKIVLMGEGLFIPIFFVAIGIRLDLPVFAATLIHSLAFVLAILAALLIGKLLAVLVVRRTFGYDWPASMTMWSLSLPQVAATLAAAMAAFDAVNANGDRLITEAVLNAVIVLMVLTAILGPVLTELFGRRMLSEEEADAPV